MLAFALASLVMRCDAQSFQMREMAAEAGVALVHDPSGPDGGSGVVDDYFGPGVAWVDVNHDGWLDLVVGDGHNGARLYLNDGDGSFTDASGRFAGSDIHAVTGIAAADVDNDGDVDIVCGNYWDEPDLQLQSGGGFIESSSNFGIKPLFGGGGGSMKPQTMGVSFGDHDQDGLVDLYVANYMLQRDLLFRNVQGGYFQRTSKVDVTSTGWGFMGVFWDFDDDGDQDIYVSNDFGRNFLFENQGAAWNYEFLEKAQTYGIAGGANGMEPKSMGMGVAIADYDNDLDPDLYVTNYFLNALYENVGSKRLGVWGFEERAAEAGVEYPLNCWGVDFCDLDLDGDLDLVQASGFITSSMFEQPMDLPNQLWLNDGPSTGHFSEVGESVGFADRMMGRGLATGDFDRDGDLDVVVTNNTFIEYAEDGITPIVHEGRLLLYENQRSNANHWLTLRLVGAGQHSPPLGCNRSAIGARVILTAGGQSQMRDVQAGSGYLSQNSLEVEFGLGEATQIDRVSVRWSCGSLQEFVALRVDRAYRIVEGEDTAVPVANAFVRFSARGANDGIHLDWVLRQDVDLSSVEFQRAEGDLDFRGLHLDVDHWAGQGRAIDRSTLPGREYAYRMLIHADGMTIESPTLFAKRQEESPPDARPRVGQNVPNPFNPSTTIEISLPRRLPARLFVTDLRGRVVRTLVERTLDAGYHYFDWDGCDDAGRGVASGSYVYVLATPEGGSSRILSLVR